MKYYDIGLISIYYFRIAINFSYVRMIPKLYPKLEWKYKYQKNKFIMS